nr:hypothetical protein [Namystynia karyoxenos]
MSDGGYVVVCFVCYSEFFSIMVASSSVVGVVLLSMVSVLRDIVQVFFFFFYGLAWFSRANWGVTTDGLVDADALVLGF